MRSLAAVPISPIRSRAPSQRPHSEHRGLRGVRVRRELALRRKVIIANISESDSVLVN